MRARLVGAGIGLLLPAFAQAGGGGLPVMESVPRWDEGIGLQTYYESYGSDKLLRGNNTIANPLGLEERRQELWLEGIYYPVKERGVFFKLPYIAHDKDVVQSGARQRQHEEGIGDMEVGGVFKRYWNFPTGTADLGLAPQLRLPTGDTGGPIPAGDGSVDVGIGLDGKWENSRHMLMAGTTYWKNQSGSHGINEGDTWDTHLMYGYHVYALPEYQMGFFLIPKIEAMWEGGGVDRDGETGGLLVHGGPAIKIYKGNYLLYLESEFPIYERVKGTDFSAGNHYHAAIGVAF